MKDAIALAVLLCLVTDAVSAAGNPKPKICFTKGEETAEQLVRGGLRLREGASGCDGPPWSAETLVLWQQVDQRFGPRFKQQTDLRRGAFVREFANDVENRVQMWDGRTVLYFRNLPLSIAYCAEIKNSLQAMLKGGWPAFAKRAKLAKDEVEGDYRPCP